ncbi:MAG: LPS assembly protein LptD [Gammaproteobacteria bacterium]|nr:LPS assembly protein LptD [Gammaproteobacteria bacterium]
MPSTRARTATVWAALALLSWRVDASDLAESLWQAGGSRSLSCGTYAEPTWRLPRGTDNASQAVEVNAARVLANLGAGSEIVGDVAIHQGNRLLNADRLQIDEATSRVAAPDGVRLRQPGLDVVATTGTVSLANDEADVVDAAFVLTDLRFRGESSQMGRQGGKLTLKGASLTRCPPRNRAWTMRVAEVEIVDGEPFARARHARLELGNVPIFYAPYLRLPVRGDRASGFLFPNVGHNDDGIDVSLPYYVNLAPNYDATLTPRWIARRGTGIEGEARHLDRRSRNEVGMAFLARDALYDGELPREDFHTARPGADFEPADRWLLATSHQGRYGPWRTHLDYTAVSDNDYFVDLGSEVAVASRVSLERRAEVQYARGGLFARLWAQGFQRLEPGLEPYRRLPEANLTYDGGLPGPAAWSVGAAWSAFQRSGMAPGILGLTGERRHVEPRIRLPLSRSWGFLNLSAGLRLTDYTLDNVAARAAVDESRTVHLGIADAGLFLERDLAGGWIQTLEPRLNYLVQSYADQNHLPRFDTTVPATSYRQLFRDNRFAGLDRIGDANRVAVGLTSRLLSTTTGAERLTARVGVARHFRNRRVTFAGSPGPDETRRTSPVAGEVQTRFGPVSLISTIAWDHQDGQLDETGLSLLFKRDATRIVNVGYRRRARYDVEQTDVSFYWPLTGPWRAFGRWNHDWHFGQNIERFAGVEYAGCCLAVKLAWHQTIDIPRNRLTPDADFDTGVLLQIAFRGLGGFGTRVDSRLERGIKGYPQEGTYR